MRGFEQQAWSLAGQGDADAIALIGVGGGEPHGAPFVGVKALMLAMLEDAVRLYLGPSGSSRDEAAFWIADGRSRSVFSFPVVCETLGLEPGAVRLALRRMHVRSDTGQPRAIGRSRPNARRRAELHREGGRPHRPERAVGS